MADSMNTHTGIPSVHNGFWRIADKNAVKTWKCKAEHPWKQGTVHTEKQWWNRLANIVNGTEDVGTEEMSECTQ